MYSYVYGYKHEEVFVPEGRIMAGYAIGFIKPGGLWYPRIPGDVANATTFNFPVYYEQIEGTAIDQVVSTKPDPVFLERAIKAGKELERRGCRAIIGCCGYFANYPEIADALDVPCFLSSLMQIPIISRGLKPSQKVCVVCANGNILSSAPALKNCGVDLSKIVIVGAEDLPEKRKSRIGHQNPAKLEQELVGLVKQAVNENPNIGAILLECTVFPPYAWAIQEAVRLPVFDYTTMVNWVYNAVVRRPFAGFM